MEKPKYKKLNCLRDGKRTSVSVPGYLYETALREIGESGIDQAIKQYQQQSHYFGSSGFCKCLLLNIVIGLKSERDDQRDIFMEDTYLS